MTERYLKVISRRRVISAAIILMGAAVIAAMVLSRGRIAPSHMRSLFAGTGGAFVANGAVQFYRYTRMMHDPQALQKAAVAECDERSVAVLHKAYYLAMEALLVIGYLAMIVSAYFNEMVCYTLLTVLCTGLVVCLLCYIIVWKTM